MYTFETPEAPHLHIDLQRGAVKIVAEETGTTRVDLTPIDGDSAAQALIDATEVVQEAGGIFVRVPKGHDRLFWGMRAKVLVTVHAPVSSRATVRVGSASVSMRGAMGDVRVDTGSGDTTIEQAANVELNTGSGEIRVEHATGPCRGRTGSGRIEVGTGDGEVRLNSGSGKLVIGKAGGALKAVTSSGELRVGAMDAGGDLFTASGRLIVERVGAGRLRARTASGLIKVGVTRGIPTWLDVRTVSGNVRSDLEASGAPADGEAHLELTIHTTSGAVVLEHAEAIAA